MKIIRRRAHAMTIFAVCWTLFSVGAVFGEVDAWRHGIRDYEAVAFTSIIIFIHVVAIIYTAHLWRTEKPVPTQGIEGSVIDDLLDAKPEEIN